MSQQPNEVTEDDIKQRLARCEASNVTVDQMYAAGNFHELVGVVKMATNCERNRASGIARRLGHRMTATAIARGDDE